MIITSLESENIKRLKAVKIEPDGSLVIIGGRNGQGKTSVLDSIMYALGGKKTIPNRPIRDGSTFAAVTIVTDDGLKITRKFGGGNDSLVIEDQGKRQSSPQSLLDRLYGNLSFRPDDFLRMKGTDQMNTLLELMELDFTDVDAMRSEVYEQRTVVNRTIRRVEAELSGLLHPPSDTPEEEVDVSELMKTLNDAEIHNETNQRTRESLELAIHNANREEAAVQELIKEIEERKSELKAHNYEVDRLRVVVGKLKDADVDSMKDEIRNAGTVNTAVAAKKHRARLLNERDALVDESKGLTATIDGCNDRKKEMLASAEFPIDGLSFSDDGVNYNGVPFDQCSSAEQLRVSVAVGLAINPKLKVLLIRDGSLLDEDSLRMVAEMAAEADAQVWMERVGEGDECQIIIEDGAVVPAEEEAIS